MAAEVETVRTILPDSAVDMSFPGPEAAGTTTHPVQRPTIDVGEITDQTKSIRIDEKEAQTEIATPVEPPITSSKNGDATGDSSSASLWCPATLRSHAALMDWGFSFCKLCKQSLSPPDKKTVSVEDSKEPVSKTDSEIIYKLKFLDNSNRCMSVHTWHEQVDLERERNPTHLVGSAKPIVEVISILMTDIDEEEISWGDRDQVFRDVIKNPKVGVDYSGRELVVNSRPVLKTLRKIIKYYPGLELIGQSLRMAPPYCVFYHHMDDIKAYQLTWTGAPDHETRQKHTMEKQDGFEPCDEETYHHLDVLWGAMKKQGFDAVTEEVARYQRPTPVATYRMLWLLLKPGTTVYASLGGSLAACVISSVSFREMAGKSPKKYRVNLWCLDFDGVKLGRCPFHIDVWPFDGEREILNLDIIPAKYYDSGDGGELRRRLESRGRKYFRLLSGAQVDYEGETLGNQRRWVQGRMLIDPSTYHTYGPASRYDDGYSSSLSPPIIGKINDAIVTTRSTRDPWEAGVSSSESPSDSEDYLRKRNGNRYSKRYNVGPWAAYDNIIPKETKLQDLENMNEETSRHICLLCPREVIGFDLMSRRWELFDVELCVDAEFNTAAIENLVLPDDRIFLIKSLVHRFADSNAINGRVPKAWTADFIKHKGEGQIFLLHGSPGVGKTYTAECIAEATGRPLLSLTPGDIGTDEVRAERTLSKWFRIAEVWGAIMLLDEADVFLEKRAPQDLQRNSLVSIFLRTIEYYRGILFLTTNRVGRFDDAFVSRIHVVIRYTNLTSTDRNRIWNQFFQKLEDERGEDIKISESARDYVLESKKMTSIEWNGREIRNAFQTAVAFADYRFFTQKKGGRAVLERQDFEKVCATADAFKKYLESIPMANEASRAYRDQDRNDNFED